MLKMHEITNRLAHKNSPCPWFVLDEIKERDERITALEDLLNDALGCLIIETSSDNEHVQRIADKFREVSNDR